jgi:hypothetical protein
MFSKVETFIFLLTCFFLNTHSLVAQVAQPISAENFQKGTSLDGEQFHQDSMARCGSSLVERLKTSAALAARLRDLGRLPEAVSKLRTGLLQEKEFVEKTLSFSFTGKTVIRASENSDAIFKATQKEPDQSMTLLGYLFDQYALIEFAHNHLDRPYYYSYLECGGCETKDPYRQRDFESRLNRFARLQVSYSLSSMTDKDPIYRNRVVPRASVYGYFTALAAACKQAAFDLRERSQKTFEALIWDLENLSLRIEQGAYPDVDSAFFDTYREANAILNRFDSFACAHQRPETTSCQPPIYIEPIPQPQPVVALGTIDLLSIRFIGKGPIVLGPYEEMKINLTCELNIDKIRMKSNLRYGEINFIRFLINGQAFLPSVDNDNPKTTYVLNGTRVSIFTISNYSNRTVYIERLDADILNDCRTR